MPNDCHSAAVERCDNMGENVGLLPWAEESRVGIPAGLDASWPWAAAAWDDKTFLYWSDIFNCPPAYNFHSQ